MAERCMRIERVSNGYEVSLDDPKIVADNRKSKGSWKNPTCEYVFTTLDALKAFIEKNIDKALPPVDDYASSFDAAVADTDDDGE